MNLILSTHNVTLTKAIEEHIISRITKLEHLDRFAINARVTLERGYVRVDSLYRTNVPGVSAVGDVITLGSPGHPQLAHIASAEGILAAERIAGRDVQPLNYDHAPACTYCSCRGTSGPDGRRSAR